MNNFCTMINLRGVNQQAKNSEILRKSVMIRLNTLIKPPESKFNYLLRSDKYEKLISLTYKSI